MQTIEMEKKLKQKHEYSPENKEKLSLARLGTGDNQLNVFYL